MTTPEKTAALYDSPRTVFLDLNGTLIPSAPGTPLDMAALQKVGQLSQELRTAGTRVGLCSDSPLEQLWEFGRRIGLGEPAGFPVIAENGNVAVVDGQVKVLTSFTALSEVRTQISALASAHGLRQAKETLAPEFGGTRPGPGQWAFGAGRRASISVFGPRGFLDVARKSLREWAEGQHTELALESSPDGLYLGMHPYREIASGKRRALGMLAGATPKTPNSLATPKTPNSLLMIGNSPADWVPPGNGVQCAFVADPALPDGIRTAAWYASDQPDVHGVIDILTRLTART